MAKKKKSRFLATLSDPHFGSDCGLLPPGVYNAKGALYNLNPIQEWLWDRFIHCTQRWLPNVVGDSPFDLLINGDITENTHHGTTEVVSNDPSAHQDISKIGLAPLAKEAERTWLVEGTDCHTRGFEAGIGEFLKAERNPITRACCFPQLSLEIRKVLCHCKHHISTSIRTWTSASALGAAIAQEQAEAAQFNHRIPRVIIRSHRHKFGEFRTSGGVCIVTPPWQAMTRHARKVTQGSITPVGMIVLEFREDGDLPVTHAKIYTPDPDPIFTLD